MNTRHALGRSLALALLSAACLMPVTSARANHGPGSSGGGSSTMSGETLAPGKFELSIREDFTEFEHFSATQATNRAQQGGDFDAVERSFVTTVELAFGVIEDLQIGGSIGYLNGVNFISSDDTGDIGRGDPDGLTDMVLLAKYRVLKGQSGNLSLVAGVKLPTGRDDFELDNGEKLSPSDQPGSGSVDVPLGVAYSRFLTSRITLDASAMYTFRTEHDDYKVGNRLDAGLALAYRLNESIKDFPQFTLFGEATLVHLEKDESEGLRDGNSGSDTLYLTPGLRVRCCENASITLAPQFPVYQHVNGNQGKVEFKMALTLTFNW